MDQRHRLFRGMVAITARASLCPTTHSTKSGGTHQVAKGNVIYLVGENPDDVRMRVIGADSRRPSSDNPDDDRIIFVPGVFSIPEMRSEIAAKAEQIGGVDLVFVDTSATYFLGNQELDNTQMGTRQVETDDSNARVSATTVESWWAGHAMVKLLPLPAECWIR
jgi:hypothetical protein